MVGPTDGVSVGLKAVGGNDCSVGSSVGIADGDQVWPGFDEGAIDGGKEAMNVGCVDGDTIGSRVGDAEGVGCIRLPQVTVNWGAPFRGGGDATLKGGVGAGADVGDAVRNLGASSLPVAPEPRQMFGYDDVRE